MITSPHIPANQHHRGSAAVHLFSEWFIFPEKLSDCLLFQGYCISIPNNLQVFLFFLVSQQHWEHSIPDHPKAIMIILQMFWDTLHTAFPENIHLTTWLVKISTTANAWSGFLFSEHTWTRTLHTKWGNNTNAYAAKDIHRRTHILYKQHSNKLCHTCHKSNS